MLTLLHLILRVLSLAVFALSVAAWADPTAEPSPRVYPSEAAAPPPPSTAAPLKIKIPPGVVPHNDPNEIRDLAIRPGLVRRVISVEFLPAGSHSRTTGPLWAVFAEGSFLTRGPPVFRASDRAVGLPLFRRQSRGRWLGLSTIPQRRHPLMWISRARSRWLPPNTPLKLTAERVRPIDSRRWSGFSGVGRPW